MAPITTPTLLLDEQKARTNLERMAEKARNHDLVLKPHFKTHQSLAVGRWFKDYGIEQITVSSVKMAEYFASDGWTDITIAFPVNPGEINRINTLAEKITVSVLISDPNILSPLCAELTYSVQAYIEIDTGSGRTGFDPEETRVIRNILKQIDQAAYLDFKGFYSHPGHSYSARSKKQILGIQQNAITQMRQLKSLYNNNYPDLLCCIGDTPCCSVGESWKDIDELSPGNFIFYDLMQVLIGSCQHSDIAVALACPVVAIYPKRNTIIVHAGGIHLSKDRLEQNGQSVFGKVVRLNENKKWNQPVENTVVKSLSQEHGIINGTNSLCRSVKLGDIVGILPVHSCMTADTMKSYRICETDLEIDHLQSAGAQN